MSNSEKPECKRCGADIPVKSTEDLCPACLLSGALDLSTGREKTLTLAAGKPRSLDELPEFPFEFGDYRLLGLLGSGGMGTVYEAEDTTTGRRVALKMLEQHLDSPDMRQRFLREGRLAAGVSHPNSLYIFGSEEVEGVPVIIMEIAGGGTLKDTLKKRGPLPVPEAVDAILDVIAGLEAAYAGGVLHRDIKPSNCFVSPDGSVKIGDFGLSVSTLARDDSYITASGVIMGTPAYASPEQLRGDNLDVRADIYSVGATLFTLLSNRAPFEGDNAVQVVANAVNQKPKPLTELRQDIPPGLERVVTRCLAKDPEGRYADYTALRSALLPFSSREPEPASMKVRSSAGWVDYLTAFLIPYVILMVTVGGEELLVRPLVDRTLYSAKYYFAFLIFGFLYFSIAEGIWGAGLGKRLKGLQVIRPNGRRPGIGRALIRILLPVLCVEGFRIPLSMTFISGSEWSGLHTVMFVIVANVCGWIPVLLALRARRENGFATLWDLASGTRVVVKPEGASRSTIEAPPQPAIPGEGADSFGPYRIVKELVPGLWILAADPVLRRQVWLLRRKPRELSAARRNLARPGRLRWLQKVDKAGAVWDAFEAVPGVPFSSLIEGGKRLPWSQLRLWLHDLASELWAAAGDKTLPDELSLSHVWIASPGHAVLLDLPWAGLQAGASPVPVGDLIGQQRFLNAVASYADSMRLPLHARPVLQNLAEGKFEKLSFLTGTLRGILNRPAEVTRSIRAGSVFMLPVFVWILVFIGRYAAGKDPAGNESLGGILLISILAVLGAIGLIQLLEIPFRSTASLSIFRLAVVGPDGSPAGISTLLRRWAIAWIPLIPPLAMAALWMKNGGPEAAFISAVLWLLLWIGGAAYAVIHPHCGLHDRLAGSRVVRR